jgi:hypothetical protein
MPKHVLLTAGLLAVAGTSAQAQTTVAPPGAGRVQMQVQNPASPKKPSIYGGSIIWRTETRNDGTALVGDMTFAPGGLKAQVTLSHNTDATMPAQFLAQIKFDIPPNFPEGNVFAVQGVTTSQKPEQAGQPLDGALMKVTQNVYLMGMIDPVDEKGREAKLLKASPFFHINLFFENHHRAIVTFEKGTAGEPLFKATMAQWAQQEKAKK